MNEWMNVYVYIYTYEWGIEQALLVYNRMRWMSEEKERKKDFFSSYLWSDVVDAMRRCSKLLLVVQEEFVTNHLEEENDLMLEWEQMDYDDDFVQYNLIELDLMLWSQDSNVWEENHLIEEVNYPNLNYTHWNRRELYSWLVVECRTFSRYSSLSTVTKRKMMEVDFQETKNSVDVDSMYWLRTTWSHPIVKNFQ